MPAPSNQKTENLRRRIVTDTQHAIAELIATKAEYSQPEAAKYIAQNRLTLADLIVDSLLVHYQIRDRRR